MAASETVRKFQTMINSLPLEQILGTAETVAKFIPAPASVVILSLIKILMVLIAVKSAASGIEGHVANQSENEANQKRETFERMWEIAQSDGEITAEEKEFIRPYALDAGISDAEFELMVMKQNKHSIK